MRAFWRIHPGFFRDSAVLITGTAIAQAAGILAMPIITRLYDQSALGVLGAFVGVTSILGQLACLRYEQAIMVAEEDDVQAIVRLSLAVSAAVALALALVVLLCRESVMSFLGAPELANWLWLIPFVSFALGLFQTLQVVLSRQRNFASQSTARIGKTSAEAATQIGWALTAGPSAFGLMIGHVAGVLLQAGVLSRSSNSTLRDTFRRREAGPSIWRSAKRHAGFPLFAVPSGIASAFGQQGFMLVWALLIGPQFAGLFYLTHRILAAPTALISQSLAPAFYQRLSAKKGRAENEQAFIAAVFVGLFFLGAIPLAIAAVFGPWLFGTCFGPEWEQSGYMVRATWPTYLMMFCAVPITQAFYVYEKQALGFFWQVAFVVLRVVAVCVAYALGGTYSALVAYGVVGAAMYAVVIIMALGWAGCRVTNLPNAVTKAFATLFDRVFPRKATTA